MSVPVIPTQHRYAKDGYVVVPDVVPADVLADVGAEADRLLEDILAASSAAKVSDPRLTWWQLPTGEPYVLKVKRALDLAPRAGRLARGPVLGLIAASLLGAEVSVMDDKIMYKEVVSVDASWADLATLGREVRKHTDAAYFAARGHPHVVTVAVCLHDCTVESGAPLVWPGTHRSVVPHRSTLRQGPVVDDDVAPDEDGVLLTAPAGSVLAWDARLVHASGPNTSAHRRRLLVIGYTPAR